MKVNVANPIYDSVFKYLMEDERIAKTILSALLKKEVVSVKMRPHEYANVTRDTISMFRIDFAANVREEDGKEHLILVELQKTWLDTETLRFRQYLGAQYNNKDNIQEGSKKGYAIPMVAVYLLGHRVGDIEEPVIYVNHKSYDYNGNVVTKGIPDPFVESLVHNSIIVQIPLLRGQVNNRLEKVLSVFDQTKMYVGETQLLSIDETHYEDDADMMYILRRLTAAAADPMMRQDMNVEDEYFSTIEDLDTQVMKQKKELAESKKEIAENKKEIAENKKEIAENKKEIAENKKQLAEKDNQLAEQKSQLAEKDNQLAEKDNKLAEKDNKLAEKDDQLAEKDKMIRNVVRSLSASGMSVEAIAQVIGLDSETIARLR